MLFVCIKPSFSQIGLPQYADSISSTYYHQRWSHFNTHPQTKGDIFFLGNSIMDGAEWSELFQDNHIKNRASAATLQQAWSYRQPTAIYLHKGWNTVLVKLPVGSFATDSQIPVKWTFTIVEVK